MTPTDLLENKELAGPVPDESHTPDIEKPSAPQVVQHDALEPDITGADRKALLRKLDLYLLPLIMLLYLLSYLDRINIGNARLYHLEENLHLAGNQFQTAVSIFSVTYILCTVPSNLVIKRFTPRYWISFIAVSWGLIATLTGLTNSYGGLVACRLLLGAAEAGLFPGLAVWLTFWYARHELALRVSYLFVCAAVAGALGGLLGYAIGHMDGVAGLSGWRWIFFLEGVPTFVVGVATFWLLPNEPASAYFLDAREKSLMRAKFERDYGITSSSRTFHRLDMWKAFRDWKVWTFSVSQFCAAVMLHGYSTFLPTIIRGLGTWTTAEVQLLTIPCYFVGAATFIMVAYLSDRLQRRGIFCVICGSISVVGYGVLITAASSGVHYFGCLIVALGLYSLVGIPLAWLPNNCPRFGKKATATGLQIALGNIAGVVSPFLYPTAQGPRYIEGHAVTLSLVGVSVLIFGLMSLWFRRENRKRAAGQVKPQYQALSEDELAELGDDSPHFRYVR